MAKQKPSHTSVRTVIDNRGGPRRSRATGLRGSNGGGRASTTFTVRVPLVTQQRGTRKMIITPPGQPAWQPKEPQIDDALIKALARAHRWKRMIEAGKFATLTELAEAENVTESYLARILRLNLLSPRVVEAALNGDLKAIPQLQQLARPFPIEWPKQEASFLSMN